MFIQLLLNGLIAGAIYSIAAAGFSVVYSTCKFANFAHGAIAIISGYILFASYTLMGVNFWLSSLIAIMFTILVGYLSNYLLFKKLRRRKCSPSVLLVASLCLMIIVESLLMLRFGADVKTIDYIRTASGINIFGGLITVLQLTMIGLSIIIFCLLFWFMKYNKIGKAMRAVTDNKEVAETIGISSERIYSWSFVIASALAAVAGIFISLEQNLVPNMGTGIMIKAFAASIIGGVGNIPGAIIGGLILGLAENFGIWFLPSGYKDAIAFLILFLFLLFKPEGIISASRRHK